MDRGQRKGGVWGKMLSQGGTGRGDEGESNGKSQVWVLCVRGAGKRFQILGLLNSCQGHLESEGGRGDKEELA